MLGRVIGGYEGQIWTLSRRVSPSCRQLIVALYAIHTNSSWTTEHATDKVSLHCYYRRLKQSNRDMDY